ncbi:hypothetical protein C0995_015178 [Termitomyces sp. Mi166|nr:hypothetical protein C0995_015178 [Termitomyces sp. Mi166\
MSRSDLKQVSALFEACIAQIRSKPQQNFDKEAEQYIKNARVAVMKEIEKKFREIAQNADNPKLLPYWAINSSTPLTILAPDHSRQMDSYIPTFKSEFQQLMDECGFNATVDNNIWGGQTYYSISIRFPTTTPQNSATKYFTKCFTSLPKFSAAVLKITQGIETPAVPEPDASPGKRGARRATARKSAKKSAGSALGAVRSSKQSQGMKRSRDEKSKDGPASVTKTPKRLRSSASVLTAPEEHVNKVEAPRRSKRLQGLKD